MAILSTHQIGEQVPRMYRVALRIMGDCDKANDVVQDACLSALETSSGFAGHGSVAGWLYWITVRCALAAMRDQHRQQQAYDAVLAEGPPPGPFSPAVQAEQEEAFRLAWRLLAELPEEHRTAFVLTQLDGYGYDEAAEIEGEPRGTIASRVWRAKKMLLEQMNAQMGTEESDHD
jgi:RNA polymerase sigma-70 factor (ECF subfamily)